MIHDGMKASAAAMRVGYESPSQFSREFKRYFGLTPGEDAARIRTMQGCNTGKGRPGGRRPPAGKRQALQYFFLMTTNSVPSRPASSRAIGRIIRQVIT